MTVQKEEQPWVEGEVEGAGEEVAAVRDEDQGAWGEQKPPVQVANASVPVVGIGCLTRLGSPATIANARAVVLP